MSMFYVNIILFNIMWYFIITYMHLKQTGLSFVRGQDPRSISGPLQVLDRKWVSICPIRPKCTSRSA